MPTDSRPRIVAIVAGWAIAFFASSAYLFGRPGTELTRAGLYVVAITPMGLLAIWCALGGAHNVVRLTATAGICLIWTLWIRWVASRHPGEVLSGFVAIVAPLFVARLFGWTIRPVDHSSARIAWRELVRPRLSLRNLVEILTVAAVLMSLHVTIGLRQLYDYFGFVGVFWLALSGLACVVTWAALGNWARWLRTITLLLAPLPPAFLPAIRPDLSWLSLVFMYGTAVAMGTTLLAFRALGYRLVHAQQFEGADPLANV